MTVSAERGYNATDPYNPDYVQPDATTGTMTDTPVIETPLNVQVITKQMLKDQQVINLDQALKNVSGVTSEDAFLAPTLKWNISPRVPRRPWNLSTSLNYPAKTRKPCLSWTSAHRTNTLAASRLAGTWVRPINWRLKNISWA